MSVSAQEESNIYVFETAPEATSHSFTNSEVFESHITETTKPDFRLVSSRPFCITEQAMRKLMCEYNIDGSIFDLVVSFGDKPRSSDAGSGAMSVRERENGAYDMQYLFTYAENDSTGAAGSWKIRQVCVFHRHGPPDHRRTINKTPGTFLAEWSSIHLLTFSTYMGGWRWYIRSLGDELERTVNIALSLASSDPKARYDNDGVVQLLTQQYLGDRLLPLAARLGAGLKTLRKLEEGHLEGVNVLRQKVRGILDLFAVAVTVENQAVTVDINSKILLFHDRLLSGTNQSLRETNTTVRIVTLVTLIYLPATFVSTLLGMNLFNYGPGGHFEISPQFWLFVVLAAPLTILTVGS
ncbi:hypothetical protein BJX62DRAFT_222253 [Aspergillus germanicus]